MQSGGCICGKLRFKVTEAPLWVTVCYCSFCQRSTGSDHMIEPIFDRDKFEITSGSVSVFTLPSSGSGKDVHVHFCADCGTKLALTFERWPDRLGVFAGVFDKPDWFEMSPKNTKHIFASEAPRGTVFPAGFPIYDRHATENDGTPLQSAVFDTPHTVGVQKPR